MCAAPACSNSTLEVAFDSLAAGCGLELAAIGYSASLREDYLAILQSKYPAIRKIICLKKSVFVHSGQNKAYLSVW